MKRATENIICNLITAVSLLLAGYIIGCYSYSRTMDGKIKRAQLASEKSTQSYYKARINETDRAIWILTERETKK